MDRLIHQSSAVSLSARFRFPDYAKDGHPQMTLVRNCKLPGTKRKDPKNMIYWLKDYALGLATWPRSVEEFSGADLVLSMVTEAERVELGMARQGRVVAIPDRGLPPDREAFREAAQEAAQLLQRGGRVVVHCRAGIGRSGMMAACILGELGLCEPEKIWRLLREARGLEVPDTEEQRSWAEEYLGAIGGAKSLEEALRRAFEE